MNTKYKINDKVIVKATLNTNEFYGDWNVSDSMLLSCGEIRTIDKVIEDYYTFKEDVTKFGWTDEMIEGKVNDNTIFFSRENDTVIIPSKREEDAGYDIYANFEEDYIMILPHETKMIPTGLRSAFSSDYVAILKERGSTGTKGIAQRAGIIDSNYRGIWQIPLTNTTNNPLYISKITSEEILGDFFGKLMPKVFENVIIYPYTKAICQALFVPIPKLNIVEKTPEEIIALISNRGEGKLGSSNK